VGEMPDVPWVVTIPSSTDVGSWGSGVVSCSVGTAWNQYSRELVKYHQLAKKNPTTKTTTTGRDLNRYLGENISSPWGRKRSSKSHCLESWVTTKIAQSSDSCFLLWERNGELCNDLHWNCRTSNGRYVTLSTS
jgi:hypothetical protein